MTFNTPKVQDVAPETREFPVFDPGNYTVELRAVNATPKDENGTIVGTNFSFEFGVMDGPEQKNGREINGQTMFENCFVMTPEHRSYEKWAEIGLAQLKFLLVGLGIEADSSGDWDPEEVIGEQYNVQLEVRKPSKKDLEAGFTDKRNRIKKFLDEE